MEERKLNITFSKSGSGSITPKLSLPSTWIKEMNISQEDREVIVKFENGKIIIEKGN